MLQVDFGSEQLVNICRPIVQLKYHCILFVRATAELGNSYITASWDRRCLARSLRLNENLALGVETFEGFGAAAPGRFPLLPKGGCARTRKRSRE